MDQSQTRAWTFISGLPHVPAWTCSTLWTVNCRYLAQSDCWTHTALWRMSERRDKIKLSSLAAAGSSLMTWEHLKLLSLSCTSLLSSKSLSTNFFFFFNFPYVQCDFENIIYNKKCSKHFLCKNVKESRKRALLSSAHSSSTWWWRCEQERGQGCVISAKIIFR